ncbi:MAG TPA: hypothetical protein VLQ80_16325 [Candidatus Saccharimonadia bacterium]|nr:hypothetical protein [Candidatus Saccharimonadia bacterium]
MTYFLNIKISKAPPATHSLSTWKKTFSVAERSFSFLNRVQMCVKPMAQPILGRSRQLQDEMRKTERLKDCKEAPSVHDNMRALRTQLLKGERLARLVGKSHTRLCVGKQMIQTIA